MGDGVVVGPAAPAGPGSVVGNLAGPGAPAATPAAPGLAGPAEAAPAPAGAPDGAATPETPALPADVAKQLMPEPTVPHRKFDEVWQASKQYRAQAQQLETAVRTLREQELPKAQRQIEELTQKLAGAEASNEEFELLVAVVQSDPDLARAFQEALDAYERTPAGRRFAAQRAARRGGAPVGGAPGEAPLPPALQEAVERTRRLEAQLQQREQRDQAAAATAEQRALDQFVDTTTERQLQAWGYNPAQVVDPRTGQTLREFVVDVITADANRLPNGGTAEDVPALLNAWFIRQTTLEQTRLQGHVRTKVDPLVPPVPAAPGGAPPVSVDRKPSSLSSPAAVSEAVAALHAIRARRGATAA